MSGDSFSLMPRPVTMKMVNTTEKKYFSSQSCVKTNLKVLLLRYMKLNVLELKKKRSKLNARV